MWRGQIGCDVTCCQSEALYECDAVCVLFIRAGIVERLHDRVIRSLDDQEQHTERQPYDPRHNASLLGRQRTIVRGPT